MKKMTCKQLGGACDIVFEAKTFEEMAELSRKHGMEMYQAGDQSHLDAMKNMQELMQSPENMSRWMAERKAEFDASPDYP